MLLDLQIPNNLNPSPHHPGRSVHISLTLFQVLLQALPLVHTLRVKYHIRTRESSEETGHMDCATVGMSQRAVLGSGVRAYYMGRRSIAYLRDLQRKILQICWDTRRAMGLALHSRYFVVSIVRRNPFPLVENTILITESLPGLLTAIQHTRTRKQYEIPGSYGSDCIRSCCCCCCVLVQDEREIKYREEHARRNAGPAAGATVMAPYVSSPTMAYAPPPR